MAVWLWFVALSTLALTAFNVFSKLAAGKVEPLMVMTLGTIASAIIFSIFTLVYYYKNNLTINAEITAGNIGYAIAIGASVTLVNLGYIFAFAKGGPVGAVGPIISAVSTVLLVALGVMFFTEGITVSKIVGVILLTIGFIFLMKN